MGAARGKIDAEVLLAEAGWVRDLARRLVGDADVAEDVAQETWIAALERGPRTGVGLRAWLAVVARNFALSRLRAEATRASYEERAARPEAQPAVSDEVERMQWQRSLADAVLGLDEPYRSAVILRHLDGLSPVEIARRQGVSNAAARQRVSRGLAMLRERLDREHDGERRAWCLPLAALARPFGEGPLPGPAAVASGAAPTIVGGIAMSSKWIAVAAVLAVLVTGLALWAPWSEAASPRPEETARAGVELAELDETRAAPTADQRSLVSSAPLDEERSEPAAVLDPERALAGRVLDFAGLPLAGARIELRRSLLRGYSNLELELDKTGRVLARAESDELGEFAFEVEAARDFDLRIEAEDHAPGSLVGKQAGEHLEVRLTRAAAFAGTVERAQDGSPVADAQVRGWTIDYARLPVFEGRTDALGRFRFEGLAPGGVRVEVVAREESSPPWVDLLFEEGRELRRDFQLQPGIRLRGRVTDAVSGRPVPGAEVGQGWTFGKSVRCDARGEYDLQGYANDGYYEVYVRAPGYGESMRALPTDQGDDIRLDLELTPGRRARGRVVDERGAPLQGVYVAAVGRGGNVDWQASRSEADGSFLLVDLGAGLDHTLFLRHDGLATLVYEFPARARDFEEFDLGDVTMFEGSSLRGVLEDEHGEPRADRLVRLKGSNADRLALAEGREDVLTSYLDEREALTDARGRFGFADLAPGTYTLRSRRDGEGLEVSVGRAEELVDLRLVIELGQIIAGQVVDPEGRGFPGALVFLQGGGDGQQSMEQRITDAAGRFEVTGLVEGEYTVQVLPVLGGRDDVRQVTLEGIAAGTRELVIELEPAIPTTGRVVDRNGVAVPRAQLTAFDDEGEELARAYADGEGRFALMLPEGLQVDLEVRRPLPSDAFWQRSEEAVPTRFLAIPTGTAEHLLTLPDLER